MDQNFVKLFKCSQVLIDFLLSEFNRIKSSENERKSQNNLIRENKKLRKLLEIQQKAMTYSRTFNGENVECPHCPKVFFDPIFLKTHITRRHPNESLDSEGMLSLTNKINEYQKVLIGDTKSLDELKNEIQVLTQKLAKTEGDLISEKDERIKLEERFEYILRVRDKEIQQTFKEELEEFKFVQREKQIEDLVHSNHNKSAIDYNKYLDKSEDQNSKPSEIHKIEEIIAIQAKEMIKLGNNVQKLVSHLSNKSEKDFKPKPRTLKVKSQAFSGNREEKIKTNEQNQRQNKCESIGSQSTKSEDFSSEKNKRQISERKEVKIIDIFNDIEQSLNSKLVSFGIGVDSKGISDEQYSNAMKKLNEERNLLISQNRFDYDFNAIEQQIRKFVDKKVEQRINGSDIETNDEILTIPTIEVNKTSVKVEKNSENEQKSKHSVEVIVHSSPINESKVTDFSQTLTEDIKAEDQPKEELPKNTETRDVGLKSVLKQNISDRKPSDNNEVKAKQRRIRFSEQRIEHQISPEDSSEDTSEEYPPISDSGAVVSVESDERLIAPTPALRTRKTELTLNLKSNIKDNNNDDSSEEEFNYEIDDQLMNEILQTNTFVRNEESNEQKPLKSDNNSRQTKVQELTEMIEQQLSKRSSTNKKPPIGSVNVMTEPKSDGNQSNVRKKYYDSEESD